MLHDIGKISVRESMLNKPSGLADEEFNRIRSYYKIGEHILPPMVDDEGIPDMMRHHHEHYDGTSYPDALSGNKVSLGTRILALCETYDAMTSELLPGAKILAVSDVYDAMTSEGPYRKPMSAETACAEIARCKGTRFDPRVVDAFPTITYRESKSLDVITSRTK